MSILVTRYLLAAVVVHVVRADLASNLNVKVGLHLGFVSEKHPLLTKPFSDLRACPRVDARRLSSQDLHRIREPTVLQYAWEVLDNTTWARVDFEEQGPFGNDTVLANDMFHQEVKCGEAIPEANFTMHDAIDYKKEYSLFLQEQMSLDLISSWQEKNAGVPFTGTYSVLQEAMHKKPPDEPTVTLANKRQWSRMHTHEETLFAQVSGRKGWLFGDRWAWHGVELGGNQHGGGPVPDNLLSVDAMCNIFFESVLPAYVSKHANRFMACETKPGEAIFWPGVCNGDCGWWHANCGLEAWNTGYFTIGFSERYSDTPEQPLNRTA